MLLVATDYDGTIADLVQDPDQAKPIREAVDEATGLSPTTTKPIDSETATVSPMGSELQKKTPDNLRRRGSQRFETK